MFVTERAMCVLVIQTSLPLSAPSFKRTTQGMCGRIIIGALLHVTLKPVEDTFGCFIVNHSSFLEVGKSRKTMVFYTSQAPRSEDYKRIQPAQLSSTVPGQLWSLTSYVLEMQNGMFLQNVGKFLTDHFTSSEDSTFRVMM